MKFLIVSDLFYPSKRSAAMLTKDLADELIKRKQQVVVLTSSFQKGQKFYEKKNNFQIYRTPLINLHGKNYIFKAIGQFIVFIYFLIIIKFFLKDIKKTFIYSPPIFFGILSFFIKNKIILNIQDFFPQNAIDLGILKNKFLINLFKGLEKKIYNKVDYLIVHSENSKKYIQKKFLIGKVYKEYNWLNLEKFKNIKSKTIYKKKFVFIFGGSIGPSQNLRILLKPMKKIEDKAVLHIYGDGTEKKKLKKEMSDLKIKNIKFLHYLNEDKFIKKVNQADSALLVLNNKNKTPIIPGKFNFYCACKKNVTAIVNKQSDLNKIIFEKKLGFVTKLHDEKSIEKFLKKIINKKKILKKLNLNCYKFAVNNLNIENLVNNLINKYN